MFKTLGCLVVSMTAAAWLLAWLDPNRNDPPTARWAVESVSTASRLVAQRSRLARADWRQVEVISEAGSGLLLSASLDRHDYHFLIDRNGGIHGTALWRKGDESDPLRIQVDRRRSTDPMSAAQWTALWSLLDTLQRDVLGGSHRPIRFGEELRSIYAIDEGARFTLGDRPTLKLVDS